MEKILELQRRFFRKEKNEFLNTLEEKLNEYGYEFERKSLGTIVRSVNLETKHNNPEYIFVAHYDTGPTMPFWFHWLLKFFGFSTLNHPVFIAIIFLLVLLNNLFLVPFLNSFNDIFYQYTISNVTYQYTYSYFIGRFQFFLYILFWLSFLIILFPNKKNFDDNTSGVIALLLLAKKCKENKIDNVKFVFIDNEEKGLFGSRSHKKYLEKEQLISQGCKVIGIDCVGRNEIPLIARSGKSKYAKDFQKEIEEEFGICKSLKAYLPFSDGFSFRKKYNAIDILFVRKAVLPFGYAPTRIHTSKDNDIDLNKIEKLTNVLAKTINNEHQE